MRVEPEPSVPLFLSLSLSLSSLDTDSLINDTTFILTFAHKFYTTKLQIFDSLLLSSSSSTSTFSVHRKNLFCVKGFEFSQPFCKLAYSGREVNSTNVSPVSLGRREIYATWKRFKAAAGCTLLEVTSLKLLTTQSEHILFYSSILVCMNATISAIWCARDTKFNKKVPVYHAQLLYNSNLACQGHRFWIFYLNVIILLCNKATTFCFDLNTTQCWVCVCVSIHPADTGASL